MRVSSSSSGSSSGGGAVLGLAFAGFLGRADGGVGGLHGGRGGGSGAGASYELGQRADGDVGGAGKRRPVEEGEGRVGGRGWRNESLDSSSDKEKKCMGKERYGTTRHGLRRADNKRAFFRLEALFTGRYHGLPQVVLRAVMQTKGGVAKGSVIKASSISFPSS